MPTPLPDIPERISLIANTEKVLKQGIVNRRWERTLPAERALSLELQVGRSTLRAALAILERQKLVRARHGRGWELNAKLAKQTRGSRLLRVGWLAQDLLEQQDSFAILWVSDFRARVQKAGLRFDFHHRPRCFGKNCSTKLAELVRLHPHTFWILSYSTPSMQRWFQDRGIPTLVAGHLHRGIKLPSIDIDLHSMGLHAGGMMFARGHRKVALLASIHGQAGVPAGYLEIERGVQAAFAANRHPENRLTIVYHEGRPADVCRALDRLLRLAQPPSALLIIDTDTLLTSVTHLAQNQKIIPKDLSILACYGENYFSRIVPEITHYDWEPKKFARQIYHLIQSAVQHVLAPDKCVRLMPRFVPGMTLPARAIVGR